ncbi:hypothetical protein BGZ59_010157 [Podila verticillata]|nr:hypothetical protein BGZ59_010157 [Podila verticillata]KAI9241979.1 MAG: hypothetical protein BYD32DRAFT_457437 [Podila humilis]
MTISDQKEAPQQHPPPSRTSPHILIVGGGIAGLTLAILLEKASIPYTVLERSKKIRLLGSAIALGPNVLPLLEQIGLLEEIQEHSRPVTRGVVWSEKMIPIMDLDHTMTGKRYGFSTRVIARPMLYQILMSHVPHEKIHMGKNIVSFSQDNQTVLVTCEDGTIFRGDILVGADGVYSSVRRNLYTQMMQSPSTEVQLPESDKEQLSFTSTCLVGQTAPLDASKFPFVKGTDCKVGSVVGDNKPYTWSVFSMPDESICWMVTQHFNDEISRDNSQLSATLAQSEWGPDKMNTMCDQVKPFPIPCGALYARPSLVVGDLIAATHEDKISRVMLEEKLFETWSFGRTVLMGDACHKMNPAAGLGAVAAIQDAAVLSDLIFHLEDTTPEAISQAFHRYREVRYPIAKQSYETSYQMSHLNEQSWISSFIRKVMNNLPKWIWYRVLDSLYEYRPQVSFLPRVHDHGETSPRPNLY